MRYFTKISIFTRVLIKRSQPYRFSFTRYYNDHSPISL